MKLPTSETMEQLKFELTTLLHASFVHADIRKRYISFQSS